MQLRASIATRTDRMVLDCGLDSASIFFCDRGASEPRLSYVHHVGVSEEAQHIYKNERVFETDPFTQVIDRADRAGQLVRWGDKRLSDIAEKAKGYREFIQHYSVDVVGAYVQQLLPELFLVFGVHCRPGSHRKVSVLHELLEQEVASIAQLVGDQFFDAFLTHGEARRIAEAVLDDDGKQPSASSAVLKLSRRQREIADIISTGAQNKQVAHIFGLSEFTVENHLRKIYQKLGVHNRAGMIAELFRGSQLQ